jgi:large subunit ribosomal protein L13
MALFCHYCSPGTVTIGGKNMQRQTTTLKPQEVVRSWYVVDATGKNLGRLATEVARVLIGKHKPTYTPNVDCGDYVIIINASKVVYSGDQEEKKFYYSHSMFPGGLRTRSIGLMKRNYPVELVEKAPSDSESGSND